ncbi:6-phosphogluconate dehydrogenase [Tamlana sp. 2201CG12-4]|uniref:6-phosphogluconate dehydrogenase n=1 Tax=Tamlana sp. 2201CG12-4 TaxID=3112582 RepID=UPI002DBD69EC|nr:6-phosphogluconate dehydrogenase [Tamlana sp. 2201CG12-4]MEC3908372.1 6-phosphogluconate dehydrogenase [Tamlana sp. 2201CG12-4]
MKILIKLGIGIFLVLAGYFCFIYFAHYSEGVRAGKLIKFSRKGVFFKTLEGEISQGVSESQFFIFSVEDKETQVIEDLNKFQGQFVKLHYYERYKTLFWLGDTKYFITKVEKYQE